MCWHVLRIDIKLDYELVKQYHPDSKLSHSVPPDVRQARFNSISAAYDDLRGVRRSSNPWSSSSSTSNSGFGPSRTWTGRRNQWGGFEYEPDVKPDPNGVTEPFFLSKGGVMFALVAVVVRYILSCLSPSSQLFCHFLGRHHLSRSCVIYLPDHGGRTEARGSASESRRCS